MNNLSVPQGMLAPCPFCGGHSIVKRYYNGETTLFMASCQSCPATMKGFDQSSADAITAWNARQAAAPQGREARAVASLNEMLKAYDAGALQMSSPEIGEPENDIPYHPWHEEFLHNARAALAQAQEPGEDYLVWSNQHRAWWRANSAGYAIDVREAGHYSREEAISISGKARDGWGKPDDTPDELAIPISALPEKIRLALHPERSGGRV